jgi:hypothetical protein
MAIGAPSSEATGGETYDQARVDQLVASGMDLATAIITAISESQGTTPPTPAPVVVMPPPAANGAGMGWQKNWPMLAVAGAVVAALLLRR